MAAAAEMFIQNRGSSGPYRHAHRTEHRHCQTTTPRKSGKAQRHTHRKDIARCPRGDGTASQFRCSSYRVSFPHALLRQRLGKFPAFTLTVIRKHRDSPHNVRESVITPPGGLYNCK